jgi:hypothetical protein
MLRGRPKGSKSKSPNKYRLRTLRIKRKYGKDTFKHWGAKGGNPILLKHRR